MKRLICILGALALICSLLPLGAGAVELEVGGRSALLMDVQTGTVLYEKNAHEALPPASVTKVMTLLLIMEAIDSGKIQWQDTVTASEAAAAKGGSQIYLKVGENMSVSDMVKSIAVSSANDCACAMAEHIAGSEGAFVTMMNEKVKELGMEDTNFVNCTGLDDSEEAANHRTSAYDIALMSRELLKNHPDIKKYTTIWMDTVRNGSFGLSNTNKLIRFYNGATGLKTGFTSGAGYCLSATAAREGMELIAVVMGCATSNERTAACKTMLDYGFANYAVVLPELEETVTVPVVMGKANTVSLRPEQTEGLLVDKGKRGGITTEVTVQDSAAAPVARGDKLGTMILRSGDEILAQIPLVAGEDVPRLTWLDLFVITLRKAAMAKEQAQPQGSVSGPAE